METVHFFYKPAIPNPVQYFGFDLEKAQPSWLTIIPKGFLCPDCQGILKYEHNTYANLGAYICEGCGCKRPDLDYRLTELSWVNQQSLSLLLLTDKNMVSKSVVSTISTTP